MFCCRRLTNKLVLFRTPRTRGSVGVCWKCWVRFWGAQLVSMLQASQPACSATLSPTTHFLPQNVNMILYSFLSSRSIFPLFSLWHLCAHRPAEFRDFYRKCQRHIPSQDTGAQVVFQDLSGGASLNRRGQEPQLCSCLQRYTGERAPQGIC